MVFQSMKSQEGGRKTKANYKKFDKKVNCPENGTLISESDPSSKRPTSSTSRTVMSSAPRAHVKGVSKAKVKTVKLTITVIGKVLLFIS